jgi:TonB family protein
MKAWTILRSTCLFVCAWTLLLFVPYATAQQGGQSGSPPAVNPAAFADALSPAHGVSCHLTMPAYTESVPDKGAHGSLHITYVVNTVGGIDLVLVDQSSGYPKLDDAARNAMLKATCSPYVVDGVAHRVVQHVTFNFGPSSSRSNPSGATASSNSPAAAPVPVSPASEPAASTPPAPSVAAATPPPSAIAASTASQADEIGDEAALRKINVAPHSPSAVLIELWGKRIDGDPDIRRIAGPNQVRLMALTPAMRSSFFRDGVLRLSPDDRSKFAQLTLNELDKAPEDCGGTQSELRLLAHAQPLSEMSTTDLEIHLNIEFDVLKQTGLGTPPAHITEEQRNQGEEAVLRTLQGMLGSDLDAARAVAHDAATVKGIPPEVACKDARLVLRAILATPQPYRDWMLLASETISKAKRAAAHGNARIEASTSPIDASAVLEHIARNVAWPSDTLDVETTVTVRCSPDGKLLSETIARSSGNASWDATVIKAIQAANPLPVQSNGTAETTFNLILRSAG